MPDVNEEIQVQLTMDGKIELRRQHNHLKRHIDFIGQFVPPLEDRDGWSTWKFRHLMQTFGPMMKERLERPFEEEMRIPIEAY